MKRPDAILCADLHIWYGQPRCRTDVFKEALIRKINWLKTKSGKIIHTPNGYEFNSDFVGEDIPIICAGDVFHKWNNDPALLADMIETLPHMICIPGQHDVPGNTMSNYPLSSLRVLEAADAVSVIRFTERKTQFSGSLTLCGREILLVHELLWAKKPWTGLTKGNAVDFINKNSEYDLIVSGDNHEPFVVQNEKTLLVNPGSFTRMTAAQKDHKPRVYLWYAKTNTVEPLYIPIEEDVVSNKHLAEGDSLDGFVAEMKEVYDLEISFVGNMKQFLSKNRTRKEVRDIIWRATDG